MSFEVKREFELRFKGLTEKPLVVAKNDGYLKYPNEVVHVIEKNAYTKAVEALKKAQKNWCITPICECHICTGLKELGELR
ncbi:hypothetical protein [Bdellovibrio bacteriovorus]|uniref:hypothetical protein n=1 Tax=Bdellovibrio bacteriovorus TaxID=959 RepID=UPI0035A7484B